MSQANDHQRNYRIDFTTLHIGAQVWLDNKPMVVLAKTPAGSDIMQGGRMVTTQVNLITIVPRNRVRSNPECAMTVTIDRLRTRSASMIEELGAKEFQTIFELIANSSVEMDDWEPSNLRDFLPTDAPPGSSEKIEVLRRRLERGQPLWHDDDRVDYLGLTGIVRPRDVHQSS